MTVLSTAATTELEAVNLMLHASGIDTIANLATDTDAAVEGALLVLSNVNREVQNMGWWFNTEYEYPLTRDGAGKIAVPANALSVDPDGDHQDVDAIVRGAFLYDRGNHTLVFTADITATIRFLLTFEELPQSARSYITTLAVRRFVDVEKASTTLHSFSQSDELRALAELKNEDAENTDANLLTGHSDVWRTFDRTI